MKELLAGAYQFDSRDTLDDIGVDASAQLPEVGEVAVLRKWAWRAWYRLAVALKSQTKVQPKLLSTFAEALTDLTAKLDALLSPLDVHRYANYALPLPPPPPPNPLPSVLG